MSHSIHIRQISSLQLSMSKQVYNWGRKYRSAVFTF